MASLGAGRRWPYLVAVVLVGGLLLGIMRYTHRPVDPPLQVTEPRLDQVSALGRLEPLGEVIHVFAPTALDGARVEQLYISHGQYLKQGEVIAQLDTYARRQAALAEAQQQVRVAQARLAQIKAGEKIGQIEAQGRVVQRLKAEKTTESAAQKANLARLTAELAHAEREDQRYEQLWIEGAIATSLRDTKRLIVDTLRQQIQEAQANLARIQGTRDQQIAEAQATQAQIAEVRPVDVILAQTQVAQAQAGVARAQADLDLALVHAPQDGQVLKIHSRSGELVGTQGIISLGQTQQMVAVAEIYELDISRVRVGQRATVTSKNHAFPDVLFGQVLEVGLEINKQDVLNTDPAAQFDSRIVEVKVALDPPSSRKVSGLTNLTVHVMIAVQEQG